MNERFKELAEQAKQYARDQMGHPMDPLLFSAAVFQQKFAELIVRECAHLFEVEWGAEKLTGDDVGYVVKKHFGVE